MHVFTEYQATGLTVVSSDCLAELPANVQNVCIQQSHPAKRLLP